MLTFYVKENTVLKYFTGKEYVVPTDSINAIPIKFVFDKTWDTFTERKTCQITQIVEGERTTYNLALDENNIVYVPAEIVPGFYFVSVFAYRGLEARNTVIPSKMEVVQSGFVNGGQPPVPPTPDLYQQILNEINNRYDATDASMKTFTNGINAKVAEQDGKITNIDNKKVDKTTQAEVDRLQNVEIEKKSDKTYVDNRLNQKTDLTYSNKISPYTLGLYPKNIADYLGATGATPELRCKDAFMKLRAMVKSGNFDGLNLGDYIEIPTMNLPEVLEQQEQLDGDGNIVIPYMEHEDAVTLTSNLNNSSYDNMKVQIVGFNHYMNVGTWSGYMTRPHIVMEFKGIPCKHWFNRKAKDPLPPNPDGTIPDKPDPGNYKHWNYWTKGNYNKSQMRAWLEKCFGPALIDAIGFEPLGIDRYINGVSSWEACGVEKVFLPSNLEMLGNTGWANSSNGYACGTSRQYALHALNPGTIVHTLNGGRNYIWLAEPSFKSSTYFCTVYIDGYAYINHAYNPIGVAPAFIIG